MVQLRFQVVVRWLLCLAAAISLSAGLGAGPEPLPQDRGAAGTWQRLLKLQTTASAMHTTAHPDDEHGGLLAQLSRGRGARVSLLTLTRGESGDNAIGPELFDAVGLIRTEELRVAGRYYGLDRQYFTTMTDYGFSKRLEEALTKWGRENVLREVVRIIRMDRPFVLIARFQGNPRDGHGNHEAAGLITQQAFRAAGDPARFPEQIRDGLRPWQPMKLYMGGIREDEDWTLRVDTGEYSPWLGQSYQSFARIGLAFQRSQNAGRVSSQAGSSIAYYKRLASVLDAVRLKPDTTGTTVSGTVGPGTTAPGTTAPGTTAPGTTPGGTTAPGTTPRGTTAPGTTSPGTTPRGTTAPGTTAPGTTPRGTTAPGTTTSGTTALSVVSGFSRTTENSFFDGIDTSIPGIFNALHRQAPPSAASLLSAIDVEVRAAIEAFSMQHPSAAVPALARGLRATVTAIARLSDEPDAVFILKVKEQQFQDAINAALGIDFQAIASVPGPLVPGQRVSVDVSLTNHGPVSIDDLEFSLVAPARLETSRIGTISDSRLRQNESERHALTLTVPDDAPLTTPYFERATIAEPRYSVA